MSKSNARESKSRSALGAGAPFLKAHCDEALKQAMRREAGSLGISEAEHLRRIVEEHFARSARGEREFHSVVEELGNNLHSNHESTKLLVAMLELAVKAILTRMPPVDESTRDGRRAQADEVFGVFLDALKGRLGRGEPSELLDFVGDLGDLGEGG